jgi:hypothetical protein
VHSRKAGIERHSFFELVNRLLREIRSAGTPRPIRMRNCGLSPSSAIIRSNMSFAAASDRVSSVPA